MYGGECYTPADNPANLSGQTAVCDTINGWLDCDYSVNQCMDPYQWVGGGESTPFGKYDNGTSTECCDDDGKNYVTNGPGAPRCCADGHDYVDANGNCTVTPAYCSSNSNSYSYEHISRVELNNGSRLSPGSTYSDYTDPVFTILSPGGNYTLNVDVTTNGNWTEYVRVWMDFNHDYDFNDMGEEIDLGSYTFDGIHTFTEELTIPSDAVLGETRMRVSMEYYSAPPACGTYYYGEVEDYSLKIT